MPLSPHQFSHRRSFPRRPRSKSLTKHPRYDNPCLLTTCHGFQTRFKLTDRLLKALAGSAAVDGCASQGAGWRGGDTCDDSLIDWFFFFFFFFFPWMFSCRASKRHSSLEFLELVLWKCCKWTHTHTRTPTPTRTQIPAVLLPDVRMSSYWGIGVEVHYLRYQRVLFTTSCQA